MRVCFFHSDKPREQVLADAFLEGVRANPDDTGFKTALNGEAQVAENADVAVMVGVKSRELFAANKKAGVHVVVMDKGYLRHRAESGVAWEFWRISVDAHHPTAHMAFLAGVGKTRAEALDIELKPWRRDGHHIVIAGSSQKYHDFYGLSDPTKWAKKVIARLRELTDRPIIYRPKPSWREATPIPGTEFSQGGSIHDVLRHSWALVTHGSNACFEAVISGIPCIILGDAVAKTLSSTKLEKIERPHLATMEEREDWLAALANSQWTMREMATGEAWKVIKPQLYA